MKSTITNITVTDTTSEKWLVIRGTEKQQRAFIVIEYYRSYYSNPELFYCEFLGNKSGTQKQGAVKIKTTEYSKFAEITMPNDSHLTLGEIKGKYIRHFTGEKCQHWFADKALIKNLISRILKDYEKPPIFSPPGFLGGYGYGMYNFFYSTTPAHNSKTWTDSVLWDAKITVTTPLSANIYLDYQALLFKAVLGNSIKLLKSALKSKQVDVNHIYTREILYRSKKAMHKISVLHIAIDHKNDEIVKILLNYHASVKKVDSHGHTALKLAEESKVSAEILYFLKASQRVKKENQVKIRIWLPRSRNVGHVSLEFANQYASLWPPVNEDESSPAIFRTYQDDRDLEERDPSQTICLYSLNVEEMKKRMSALKKNISSWSLTTLGTSRPDERHSCVSFAYAILKAGEIDLLTTQSHTLLRSMVASPTNMCDLVQDAKQHEDKVFNIKLKEMGVYAQRQSKKASIPTEKFNEVKVIAKVAKSSLTGMLT